MRENETKGSCFFGTHDLVLVNLLTFIHSIHSSASCNALPTYTYPIYIRAYMHVYMQIYLYRRQRIRAFYRG